MRRTSLIPADIVLDSTLSLKDKEVAALLGCFVDASGLCWPSTRHLAGLLDCATTGVTRAIKHLVDRQHLVRVKTPEGLPALQFTQSVQDARFDSARAQVARQDAGIESPPPCEIRTPKNIYHQIPDSPPDGPALQDLNPDQIHPAYLAKALAEGWTPMLAGQEWEQFCFYHGAKGTRPARNPQTGDLTWAHHWGRWRKQFKKFEDQDHAPRPRHQRQQRGGGAGPGLSPSSRGFLRGLGLDPDDPSSPYHVDGGPAPRCTDPADPIPPAPGSTDGGY